MLGRCRTDRIEAERQVILLLLDLAVMKHTAKASWMRGFIPAACLALLFGCTVARSHVHDEPWFQIPDKDWTPDPKAVEAMQAAVNVSLDDAPRRSHPKGTPVHYWFQYGKVSGDAKEGIFILGFPFPVPADPYEMLVWIPEACVISGRYLPDKGQLEQFGGGGTNCPPRI